MLQPCLSGLPTELKQQILDYVEEADKVEEPEGVFRRSDLRSVFQLSREFSVLAAPKLFHVSS